MVYVFLADGFEEIEAITPVDLMVRAEIPVKTVSITESKTVTGSKGVKVIADLTKDEITTDNLEMIVLPGGPGHGKLAESGVVVKYIDYCIKKGIFVAAICAAPTILGKMGYLKGITATCFPNMEKDLLGAKFSTDSVCFDQNIITSRGAGTSVGFGLKIIEVLKGKELSEKIAERIVYLK